MKTPLLISTKSAATLLGIAPRNADKTLFAMGLKPVVEAGSEIKRHRRWSRDEVIRTVNEWSAKHTEKTNVAPVVDDGRSRAPRQSFMRNIVSRDAKL